MKLLCMSFDGDSQLERPVFTNTDEVWEYSSDLGNKWYFYPFHFVVTDSGDTIIDAPEPLQFLTRKRTATASKLFEQTATHEDAAGMDAEEYIYFLAATRPTTLSRVKCYDNGGATFDRFTVVFLKADRGRYTYLAMSEHPTHPQGFGQHGEASSLSAFNTSGTRIPFKALPPDCQRLVNQERAL